jgi:hypothetical protein
LTENMASAAQTITTVTLVSNVAASIFLYAIIYYLWSLINQLQMTTLTIFFTIRLPANVMNFLKLIIKISAFDIFKAEFIV